MIVDLPLKKKNDAQIYYCYFSWAGFTSEALNFAKENGIVLISGKDLFLIK